MTLAGPTGLARPVIVATSLIDPAPSRSVGVAVVEIAVGAVLTVVWAEPVPPPGWLRFAPAVMSCPIV